MLLVMQAGSDRMFLFAVPPKGGVWQWMVLLGSFSFALLARAAKGTNRFWKELSQ
ncbi:MAG: hypothetical protein HFG04_02900 [Oscillibacter sp.]|jgi:hypothetical protein|nr:hypothetical protein [Oscillibacter sp.]